MIEWEGRGGPGCSQCLSSRNLVDEISSRYFVFSNSRASFPEADRRLQEHNTVVTYVDVFDTKSLKLRPFYKHNTVMHCVGCSANADETLLGAFSFCFLFSVSFALLVNTILL